MTKPEAMDHAESSPTKIRYEQPRLVMFGEIGALTAGGSGQFNEFMKSGGVVTRKPIT